MIYISIIIGCIIGACLGFASPVISYTYSSYLSIAIVAALDTVFGGIASVVKGNFDLKIFFIRIFWKFNFSDCINIFRRKIEC